MGAYTTYYVDPSIAANSGSGTVGDPYGDLQYALNRQGTDYSRDSTNGDVFLITPGTAEVMLSGLDLSTYGTPTTAAPLVIRGNGGQGEITGGGSTGIVTTARVIHFDHMKLHNTGATPILSLANGSIVHNCELTNTSTHAITTSLSSISLTGSYLHNIGGLAINSAVSSTHRIIGNYFANATNDFTNAVQVVSGLVLFNIFSIDGTTNAIVATGTSQVIGNSILCAGGSGTGINAGSGSHVIAGNIVEGFTSGEGFDLNSTTAEHCLFAGNAAYNNATNYANTGDAALLITDGDNETLSASPFAKSGANTFANRFTYFEPVDEGNVLGGAYPFGSNLDKGAVQKAAAVGGGFAKFAGFGGGFVG